MMQLIKDESLIMRAHLVIVIGSRHILLWDMDKDGKLADQPNLVGTTTKPQPPMKKTRSYIRMIRQADNVQEPMEVRMKGRRRPRKDPDDPK